MTVSVWIASAKGDEAKSEQLAAPIRAAGYDVSYNDLVRVGESVIETVIKHLRDGAAVVVCGTTSAMGTKMVHRVANAARSIKSGRLFVVQMDEDADVETISLGERIAEYWKDPNKAEQQLITALKEHHPLNADARALVQQDNPEAGYSARTSVPRQSRSHDESANGRWKIRRIVETQLADLRAFRPTIGNEENSYRVFCNIDAKIPDIHPQICPPVWVGVRTVVLSVESQHYTRRSQRLLPERSANVESTDVVIFSDHAIFHGPRGKLGCVQGALVADEAVAVVVHDNNGEGPITLSLSAGRRSFVIAEIGVDDDGPTAPPPPQEEAVIEIIFRKGMQKDQNGRLVIGRVSLERKLP